jgi:hypothetical protein
MHALERALWEWSRSRVEQDEFPESVFAAHLAAR